MTQLTKIPATIVTGFLGSGKTTLLSNVLKKANGKRIAVIVNEFGELDIDAELLRNCPLECEEQEDEIKNGIYELANGCICCTVEEEFLPVMKQLVDRRDEIDNILIETSGLALPKPLVQAFNWPEIKQYCTVDAVITLVDGPAVAEGRWANDVEKVNEIRMTDENLEHESSLLELLDDQLSAADLVLVSKNDLLQTDQREQVEKTLSSKLSHSVKVIYISNASSHPSGVNNSYNEIILLDQLNIDTLMGIGAGSENNIDTLNTHHDHHHQNKEHHEHAHDHFDSCVVTIGEVHSADLHQKIKQLIEKYNIYRVKGFAAEFGKPMRQVVQAVGERLNMHYDRMWGENELRKTQIVFIGKDINKIDIQAQLVETECSRFAEEV